MVKYCMALPAFYYESTWQELKQNLPDPAEEEPLRTSSQGNWSTGSVKTHVELWLITVSARTATWLNLQCPDLILTPANGESLVHLSKPY